MKSDNEIDPNHGDKRSAFRGLGFVLIAVGGILAAVGFLDFFSSFGDLDAGMPKAFPLAFIGIPLLTLGWRLIGAGFLGTITRYGAGEMAPVAKDALEYLSEGKGTESNLVACTKCGTKNDPDAAFCDSCGTALGRTCPHCSAPNDTNAKFCDACGKPLTA